MYLLIFTTLLSFMYVTISYITAPLIKWLNRPTKQELEMTQEIAKLQVQQSELSLVDNFAQHAKIQRKINTIKRDLGMVSDNRTLHKYTVQLSLTIASKAIVAIATFTLLYFYRKEPVFVFPNHFDLYPFTNIISYPVNTPGAVSVPFWLLVSNCIARKIVS